MVACRLHGANRERVAALAIKITCAGAGLALALLLQGLGMRWNDRVVNEMRARHKCKAPR